MIPRLLIAILRGITPEEVQAISAALVRSGIGRIEVPLNSPEALRSIELLVRAFGDRALVGAGTVLTTGEVHRVAAVGARFIVSPDTNIEVIAASKSAGLTSYPGVCTPTECFRALRAGADGLKCFPADVLGPGGLMALRAVLPSNIPLIPVGGINATTMGPWLDAGATGFGIGSALYQPGYVADTVARFAAEMVFAFDSARSG